MFREPQKLRCSLFQCVGAQGFERFPQIAQRFGLRLPGIGHHALMQRSLFCQQLLRAGLIRLRRGEVGFNGNHFAAELGEFPVALLQLLAQFVFQGGIGRRG